MQGETCYVSCFFDAENLNTRFFDITTNNSQKSEQPGYIRIPSSEFKVIKEKKADLLLDDSQSEENNIEEPTKNYGDSAEPEDRMGQNIKMESEEEYIKALTKRLGWEDYELSDPKVTSGKDMGMDADLKTRALAYSKGGIRQKLPIILAFQLDDSNDIVSTYLMENDTSSSSEHFNRIAEIIINTDDVTLRKSTITDSVNDAIDSDGDMIDMGNGLKFGYDSSFGDTGISMFLFTREDIS